MYAAWLHMRHAVRVSGCDYSITLQTALRYGWRCTHRLAWRSTAQSGDAHLSHWWAMKGSDDAAKNTERGGTERASERERVQICLLSSFMTLTTRPVFTDVWAASVSAQKQRWHRTHMHPTLSPYPRTTFPAQGHWCALKMHSDLAACSSLHAIFFF